MGAPAEAGDVVVSESNAERAFGPPLPPLHVLGDRVAHLTRWWREDPVNPYYPNF